MSKYWLLTFVRHQDIPSLGLVKAISGRRTFYKSCLTPPIGQYRTLRTPSGTSCPLQPNNYRLSTTYFWLLTIETEYWLKKLPTIYWLPTTDYRLPTTNYWKFLHKMHPKVEFAQAPKCGRPCLFPNVEYTFNKYINLWYFSIPLVTCLTILWLLGSESTLAPFLE